MAVLQLFGHIALDHMHRHMTRAFNHHLHVVFPGDFGQFAQRMQLGELRLVVGILNRAWTQAVAERERNVIGGTDFANLAEMFKQEVLFVMRETPFRHDRTAARDNTCQAFGGHRHVAQQYARVNGEVVDALFGLFEQRVAEGFPGEIFGDPVNLLQRLVDRYGTDRHRAVTQDPLAGFVNIAAGGEVHYRICAPAGRPHQLLHLFFNGGGHRRVTDVGVHLHQEVAADDHRLGFRVVDVGRNNRAARSDFITHEFRGDVFRQASAKVHPWMLMAQHFTTNALAAHVFTDGDKFHLRGNHPLTGIVQLGNALAGFGAFWRQQAAETQLVQAIVGQTFFGISGATVV